MNRRIVLLFSLLILAFSFKSKGQAPITGPATVCMGSTINLSSTDAGGTWTSSAPGVATIAIGGATVFPVTPGTTVISYSSTAGVATTTITVFSAGPITGPANVCQGSTITLSDGGAGGVWSVDITTIATISAAGVVTGGTPSGASSAVVVTLNTTNCGTTYYGVTVYPTMQPIVAAPTPTVLCSGTTFQLSDPIQGGTWTSSNLGVATIALANPPAYLVAAGTTVISYTNFCGTATHTLTVNSSPGAVIGLNSFCIGSTGLLTSTPGGGTWTSSNTLIADVNLTTGIVAGTGVGSACITYTLANLCTSVFCLNINNCPPCPVNSDFELGNYSNWFYYVGSCCDGAGNMQFPPTPYPGGGYMATPPTPGIPCAFALTGQVGAPGAVVTGTDPFGGFPVVGAGVYSLRIGSGRSLRWAEKAVYYVHVPTSVDQYSLIYQYAVVMEDPGHSSVQQPRFQVKAVNVTGVADSLGGGTPVPCANFLYVPSGGLPGWSQGTGTAPGGAACGVAGGGSTVWYKPWATTSINLSSLGGATIRMEFAAGGCEPTGHFGYGYVDMTCGTFAISNLSCGDSIATVTAPSGFANYSWYDSINLFTATTPPGPSTYGTTQTITFPTPSVPTTYAVVMTPYVNFGCPDTLYVRLRPSNLQLHPKPDTMICAGQSAQISVNATDIALPLTYSWAPVAGLSCATCANPIATPVAGVNVYTVIVTNDAGCEKSGTQRVVVDSAAITTSATATSCFGYSNGTTTATPTSGRSPYSYTWTTVPTQTTSTATGLAIGTYSVTMTDSLGCTTSGNATVTQPPALTMSIAGTTNPDSCNINNGRIILAGDFTTGNTYTVTYLYMATGMSTTAVVTTTVTATPNLTFTGLGKGIYDSIKIIPSGCPYNSLGPVTLVDPPPPALPYVNSNSPVCDGQPINFTTTSITPGVTYSWSGPNGFTSAIQTPSISVSTFNDSGWYKVTVMVRNCYSTDSTKVRVIENPDPAAFNNSPKCSDIDTVRLTSINNHPGSGDAYVWDGPLSFHSTFQNPILIHPAPAAAGTYTVSITRNGCTMAAFTTVTVHPTPAPPDILDTNYCQFATPVPLSATGINILWYTSPSDNIGTSVAPTPNTSTPSLTTWYATQTSNTVPACKSAKAPVTVGVYAIPTPKFTITDSVFCEGTYFTFAVVGENTGIDYQGLTWTFGSDIVRDVNPVLHSFSEPGDVDVVVNVNYKVCPDAEMRHLVKVYPYPSLQLGDDTAICPGSQKLTIGDKKNELDPAARWIWNTGDRSANIDVVAPGTYYVKVTSNGCSTSDTILVANDCYMNMPNVFTPNGDGVNDYFFPRQFLTRGVTSFGMTIYNRWGQVVFESKNTEGRGWDGTYNNVPQPQGVFIYVVDATFKDGQKEHHQGNITLLR